MVLLVVQLSWVEDEGVAEVEILVPSKYHVIEFFLEYSKFSRDFFLTPHPYQQ